MIPITVITVAVVVIMVAAGVVAGEMAVMDMAGTGGGGRIAISCHGFLSSARERKSTRASTPPRAQPNRPISPINNSLTRSGRR